MYKYVLGNRNVKLYVQHDQKMVLARRKEEELSL